MSKVNIVLDASKFDMFEVCPCRYYYRYVLKRVPTESAPALDRGSLIHAGCEAYYKALKDGLRYESALEAAKESVSIASASTDAPSVMINRVQDVLMEHFDHWRVQDESLEILEVEIPFSYVLYEDDLIRVVMTGKIDLLVNDHNPQSRYENLIIDHKSYEREFPIRRRTNQFMNYVTAVNSNFLRVNRIGMQTSVPVEKKMKRITLSYDPLMREQWKENVGKILATHFMTCVVESYWPMNDTSCDKYNRICEYNDVCDSSGVEAKSYKLDAFFKEAEEWDVSATLVDK